MDGLFGEEISLFVEWNDEDFNRSLKFETMYLDLFNFRIRFVNYLVTSFLNLFSILKIQYSTKLY